jgi:hypothetical protein
MTERLNQWLEGERGQLMDEGRKPEFLRGSHSILVPKNVQIEYRPPEWSPTPWASTVACLVYQVPEAWMNGGTEAHLSLLEHSGEWAWERGEKVSADTMITRARRGYQGYRGGATPSGLLKDFLKLALPETVIERVVTFVKRWGPLWLCRTPKHHAEHRICFWQPRQAVYWSGTTTLCSWHPVEEVYAFVREAQQAKMVVEAIGELRRLKLLEDENKTSITKQIVDIREAILSRLTLHGQLELRVNWRAHPSQPKLLLLSKIGFIHAVWIEIFQLLCQGKGPLQCDDCGTWYYREVRRAKTGQRQYCADCGKNGRASKRRYADRRRNRDKLASGVALEQAKLLTTM